MEPKTIADRIFDATFAGGELDEFIENLLGSELYYDSMIEDGWDYYDGSLELIFKPGFRGLTREEADAILGLGFDRLYESNGEKGVYWDKDSNGICSPREHSGTPVANEIHKLRKIVKSFLLHPSFADLPEEQRKQIISEISLQSREP